MPVTKLEMTAKTIHDRNIVSGGSCILTKHDESRSNLELTSSLKGNFVAAKHDYASVTGTASEPSLDVWTAREATTLYVPRVEWKFAGLQEEDIHYEITVKLFFLPSAPVSERSQYISNAVSLVLKELKVDSIDLIIASFPGMSFDGDCEWEADKKNAHQGNDEEEVETWSSLEELHKKGIVRSLGIAEFGSEKLQRFINRINMRPIVDQINVRDCCNAPPPLVKLAKAENIELLVHKDCTDILPRRTLRELLGHGPQGAGLVSDPTTKNRDQQNVVSELTGELVPQWVVKYTAVVRNRGVIENKGYFAGAALVEE